MFANISPETSIFLSPSKNVKIKLNTNRNLSPALREEHRLPAPENKVRRRISRLKEAENIGEWRKLQNEELLNSYFLPRAIRDANYWWSMHNFNRKSKEKRTFGRFNPLKPKLV
jgi:hypothetical protein